MNNTNKIILKSSKSTQLVIFVEGEESFLLIFYVTFLIRICSKADVSYNITFFMVISRNLTKDKVMIKAWLLLLVSKLGTKFWFAVTYPTCFSFISYFNFASYAECFPHH